MPLPKPKNSPLRSAPLIWIGSIFRAVARSENMGGGACITVVGIICSLVEIGLAVLPNIGGLKPPKSPTPPCDGPDI